MRKLHIRPNHYNIWLQLHLHPLLHLVNHINRWENCFNNFKYIFSHCLIKHVSFSAISSRSTTVWCYPICTSCSPTISSYSGYEWTACSCWASLYAAEFWTISSHATTSTTMKYLKILTQNFFDSKLFQEFVNFCHVHCLLSDFTDGLNYYFPCWVYWKHNYWVTSKSSAQTTNTKRIKFRCAKWKPN